LHVLALVFVAAGPDVVPLAVIDCRCSSSSDWSSTSRCRCSRNSRRSSRSYSSRSSNHSNSWCSRRESRSSGKHLSSDHDSTSSRSSGNIRRHSRNRWSSRSLHALISRLLALPIFISTHCLHGKHLDGRTRFQLRLLHSRVRREVHHLA
ncbi:unnamed protein product, partial [Closterium sp. NIES-54]